MPPSHNHVPSTNHHVTSHNSWNFNGVSLAASEHRASRLFRPGIYVPTLAFFETETEDLDLETTAHHAVELARAGVAGIATHGSNGEAVHLDAIERNLITLTTRNALDTAGFTSIPIIVGCSAHSVQGALQFCKEAKESGGDAALILPPSYYKTLHTSTTIHDFFTEVADRSPIPIFLYSYPAAANGIDLTSNDIITLSSHQNIIGCKLTCGNTGKLNRVVAATNAASFSNPVGSGFLCLGGSADFISQTLVGGGSGVIAGYANIAPAQCVALLELILNENWKEAREMQAVIARGDWSAIQGGIVGLRSAMQSWLGYGGHCRRPMPRLEQGGELAKQWKLRFEEAMGLEKNVANNQKVEATPSLPANSKKHVLAQDESSSLAVRAL